MTRDYGHNGRESDGLFTMVPSGDRVNREEMEKRLAYIHNRPKPVNDCLGMSWEEIERKQGGRLRF